MTLFARSVLLDGYGKSIYFWSLVSALGTFWFGAGISGWNSVKDLLNPAFELHTIGWEVWLVLTISFAVDGFVLKQVHGVNFPLVAVGSPL